VDCLALPLLKDPFAKHRLAEAGDPLPVITNGGLGVKSQIFSVMELPCGRMTPIRIRQLTSRA